MTELRPGLAQGLGMMKRALLFLVPVLAACSASIPPQYSARLATESVFVREESSVELAERAVVAQAADDFQCPLGVVKSRIAGPDDG